MATNTMMYSEEEKNFLKFSMLNSKVTPAVVRGYFNNVFPPSSLAQTINQNKKKIRYLINKKRINATQETILRAIPGTTWPAGSVTSTVTPVATSSEDFDLTLMICLLRNISSLQTPLNGWDRLPQSHEKTDSAHLARLKFYRNELAHSTISEMPTTDFHDKWNAVEEALVHLNGGQNIQQVNAIYNYDLDAPNANLQKEVETLKQEIEAWRIEVETLKQEIEEGQKEVKTWKQTCSMVEMERTLAIASEQQIKSELEHYKEGNLPKNIQENFDKIIKVWEKENEPYFETDRCKDFMKELEQNQTFTVIGHSGNGKTALVRHAALKLKRECQFAILPVENPDHILQYRKGNKKQVFVIDDVVGKYSIDLNLLKKWERMDEDVKACISDGEDIKIICTLRHQVAMTKEFKTSDSILRINQYDLDDPLNKTTDTEKRRIFLNHIQNSEIDSEPSSDEIHEICKSNFAFPLLCRLVTNSKKRFENRLQFFKAPKEIFMTELDKLDTNCPEEYFVLVVCMLFDGKIKLSEFVSDANQDTIKKVSESCRVQMNITEKLIQDSIEKMKGSFIKISEQEYTFVHDKLFESVSCHFATRDPQLMFSICSFNFISERVRIDANDDDTTILVNEASFKVLGERVLNELRHGRFLSVLISNLMRNTKFVNYFGSFIIISRISSFELLMTEIDQAQQMPTKDRVKKYLEISDSCPYVVNNDAIDQVMWFSNRIYFRLIHWIVAFGHGLLFNCLWSGLEMSQTQTFLGRSFWFPFSKPLLPLATLGGNPNIIRTLIDAGGDIFSYSADGNSVLSEAVKSGSSDIISMLIERGVSVNDGHFFGITTPLQICVDTGNAGIMEHLLKQRAKTNKTFLNGLTMFYKLYQNDTVSIETIYALVSNDEGNKEIHEAIINKDTGTLECLMKNRKYNSRTCNHNGQTVLHLAALFGDCENLKVILQENDHKKNKKSTSSNRSFINRGDINGVCPLQLSVMRNDFDCVDLLLRHGASIICQDNLGRTPVHFVRCPRITRRLLMPARPINKANSCISISEDNINPLNLVNQVNEVGVMSHESESSLEHEENESHDAETILLRQESLKETTDLFFWEILGTVFANVLFAFFPRLFTLKNRFGSSGVANFRDVSGNTPLHAIAKASSKSNIKNSSQIIDIIVKSGGDLHLRNGRGQMPFHLLPYRLRGKISALRPLNRYLIGERWILVLLALFAIFLSFVFYYLSRFFYLKRELSVPNNQQKCQVSEVEQYNDTVSESFALKIYQQKYSNFFEVMLSILLFCLCFLFKLYKNAHDFKHISKKFTLCLFGIQGLKFLKLITFTRFLVLCDGGYSPILQVVFFYVIFIDFKYRVICKDSVNCFRLYFFLFVFPILLIILQKLFLFSLILTQMKSPIDLTSSRWETWLNCSRPFSIKENISVHTYQCQANSDANQTLFFKGNLSDIIQNVDVHGIAQYNNSDFLTNSLLCSGTKAASEITYYNTLYYLYSFLLAFICVMSYIYIDLPVLLLLTDNYISLNPY